MPYFDDEFLSRPRIPSRYASILLALRTLALLLELSLLSLLIYLTSTWQRSYAASYFVVRLSPTDLSFYQLDS